MPAPYGELTLSPSPMRDGLEWGVGRSWRGEFRRREAMARAESDWREAPVGFCAAIEPPSVEDCSLPRQD